jgi:2-hydroxy-3-keto-5-methylthiopentenyl-1-phosphate phosphatase
MMRIFSDFDGTIAIEDVGDRLSRRFAGPQVSEIIGKYRDGSINARECLIGKCEAVESATQGEVEQFIDEFSLDPTFKGFVEFCRIREIPLVALSDGLDFYVGRLLTINGFGDLRFLSNHLEFVSTGNSTKLVPSFPYTDAECLLCGNCKRNHLLTLSADDDIIVYIGDGISDQCPVRYADIVFAKGSLIRHCQEQNITYHEFRDFNDVIQRLELILQQKRIKKRREAEMARREVFAQG